MSERVLVPEGWHLYDFGELASKIVGGGTPSRKIPEYWEGDIPWATVKDLTGTHLTSTQESISNKGLTESSSNLIPADTVIIATRMALGKAVIFNRDVAINQDLKAITPNNKFHNRYLLHWYQGHSEYIDHLGSGSTVKGIRLDDLKVIPVKLPPLPEQKKIASILTSVDDVIEKSEAQICKLQDLKKGMMTELLTKGIGHTQFKDSPVGQIPKSWDVRKLSEIVQVIDSLHKTPSFSQVGYPMVRVTDIKWGKLNLKNTVKVTESIYSEFVRNHVPKLGDIVMSRVGSYGVCSYVDTMQKFCIGQNTVIIKSKKISPLFLYYISNSSIVQDQIENEVAGSGYKSLSLASIRDLTVLVPSDNEQEKISEAMWALDTEIETKQQKLSQIKALKKALMNDLLTGKKRVNVN